MVDTIPTEFEVLDERAGDVKGDRRIERLDFECRWAEGPVYVPAGRYLLVSDIPNDRILRWDETTGASACSANRPDTPTATRSIPTAGW